MIWFFVRFFEREEYADEFHVWFALSQYEAL